MTPLLTISVLSTNDRLKYLARLIEAFDAQADPRIVIQTFIGSGKHQDRGGETIGAKRQVALEACATKYHCFFDDDDLPLPEYSNEIADALQLDPDVVGFNIERFTDGDLIGYETHSLKVIAGCDMGPDGMLRIYRRPNHLNPVRTVMAKEIGFKSMKVGEDCDYAVRMFERFGATMRETFIDKFLYQYLYRTKTPPPVQMYDADGRITEEGRAEVARLGGTVLSI